MGKLKYTVIRTKKQYIEYCDLLEQLVFQNEGENVQEEIDLLTLLIENWDQKNSPLLQMDPIEMLKSVMLENELKAKDLVNILNLSKGTVSKILNYQKGLSKESIRLLAQHFKMKQESFNRPYKLIEKRDAA